jgi:hypothetical protein
MAAAASGVLFSLTDFAVKLPADAEWTDIPWVTEAIYKGSHQSVELYGDDAYQGSYHFNQKGEISFKATKTVMAVLEKITGTASTSSAGADVILGGVAGELTPPVLCIKMTARFTNDAGTNLGGTVTFFNCKATSPFENFLTFANGKQSEMTLTFAVSQSTTDENGDALSEPAFFKLALGRG